MKVSEYQPLWRQVLLEPVREEKTASGIYIPERPDSLNKYKVISIGNQCIEVKPDNIVILEEKAFKTPLEFDDHVPRVQVMEQNIIGIVKK